MSEIVQHPSCPVTPWWVPYMSTLKFVDGGRVAPGVDCFGFARLVYLEQLGIDLPEWPRLTLDQVSGNDASLLEPRFTCGFNAIETGFERAFDMAVIRIPLPVHGRLKRGWWHLGVVTRLGHLVHMHNAQGLVEVPFRDTAEARASATLTVRDVRLFRYGPLQQPQALAEAAA